MTQPFQYRGTTVTLVQGDITKQTDVDVLVTAANADLRGGGGVDAAIHAAAGPELLAACAAVIAERGGPLSAGDAVLTPAFGLPVRHVIHAVGPIWQGGHKSEYVNLEHVWMRSLALAASTGARSVALPAISTGAYGFPANQAARVALGSIYRYVREAPNTLDAVRVVLFDADALAIWSDAQQEITETMLGL